VIAVSEPAPVGSSTSVTATSTLPAKTSGSLPPQRVRSRSDQPPSNTGTISATRPSAPISMPVITGPERSWINTGT
jgi:hypothetical protein